MRTVLASKAAATTAFSEKVSGAKTDRAALGKLLKRLEPGDVLVVTRLDRLARSTRDLLKPGRVKAASVPKRAACALAARFKK
jgi:Resolvase, N terminal domain